MPCIWCHIVDVLGDIFDSVGDIFESHGEFDLLLEISVLIDDASCPALNKQ